MVSSNGRSSGPRPPGRLCVVMVYCSGGSKNLPLGVVGVDKWLIEGSYSGGSGARIGMSLSVVLWVALWVLTPVLSLVAVVCRSGVAGRDGVGPIGGTTPGQVSPGS